METRVTKLLGIEYPIIQGGMAWVANANLAANVSKAGGIGFIGAANAPGEWVRSEIRKAREITDKPVGVNIMLLSEHIDEVAQVVVEEKVSVVSTGAGNPGKYMKMWKDAGIKVMPVVASVALAKLMERAGADMVIAEGMESGGHIGEQTTMTLVPQVADAVSIPVVAAGGIADARGLCSVYAWCRGCTDGNTFCCCQRIRCSSALQRQNNSSKGYRFCCYRKKYGTSGQVFKK